jgi:hypothetical protein
MEKSEHMATDNGLDVLNPNTRSRSCSFSTAIKPPFLDGGGIMMQIDSPTAPRHRTWYQLHRS